KVHAKSQVAEVFVSGHPAYPCRQPRRPVHGESQLVALGSDHVDKIEALTVAKIANAGTLLQNGPHENDRMREHLIAASSDGRGCCACCTSVHADVVRNLAVKRCDRHIASKVAI